MVRPEVRREQAIAAAEAALRGKHPVLVERLFSYGAVDIDARIQCHYGQLTEGCGAVTAIGR